MQKITRTKNSYKRMSLNLIRAILARILGQNSRIALAIEVESKRIQGKGAGAVTVVEEVAAILKLLSLKSFEKVIVLDVGANIGDFSNEILKSLPNANVYAFEPSTTARNALKDRFSNDHRISISEYAMGKELGNGILWFDFPGSGWSSLTRRRLDHFSVSFDLSEEVKLDSLDNWNKNRNLSPTILKIDVEGHELDVLKGGEKLIMRSQLIQFEFGGSNLDTRTYFQDFWYFFMDRGFTIYRLTPIGPKKLESYSEHDECFITSNYFATRSGELSGI